MPPNPYRNLAEILEGIISLMNYYGRRMDEMPSSLEPAKRALRQAIQELLTQGASEQAAD